MLNETTYRRLSSVACVVSDMEKWCELRTDGKASDFQSLFAQARTPVLHQIRQAPSSETIQGPTGVRGVQALP